jgi:hypothetical protein
MNSANFDVLVERAMRAGNRAHMRPAIEKELLHYDILFALDDAGLLDQLTFQGGTSLRLCYGSPRFSEDLDFVGGRDFDAAQLLSMKSCIERYVGARYGLEVSVRDPREHTDEPANRNVQVHKWQIRVVTAPARPDLPRQMIKIEVANVPAYTREPRQLRQNYDFLPDGYGDLVVLVESLNEIMADKLVSLVDCTKYIRHRDIWDLHWLRQQGATMEPELVRKKLADYRSVEYPANAERLIERLPQIIAGKEFADQMSRFIPSDVRERTLLKDKFLTLLTNETSRALRASALAASSAP